jgi:tetratricopeptide (TPR) repeat protein
MKRYDEALQAFDTVLSIKPEHVFALNNRGTVLCKMGRFAEAVKCYNKSLQLSPGDKRIIAFRYKANMKMKGD